eukprot:COSAG06_NODE_51587_length_311_cov_0.726415_1_plen_64_part_01
MNAGLFLSHAYAVKKRAICQDRLGTDNVIGKAEKRRVCAGNRTCDPSREFEGKCGGLYVASVMH